MTSRERLLRVLRREPTDRCPLRMWGTTPLSQFQWPDHNWLKDLVIEYALDSFHSCPDLSTVPHWLGPGSDLAPLETVDEPSDHEGYTARRTILHTPAGDLHSVFLSSLEGKPGYLQKYFLETVEDCEKWLSLPEVDFEIAPERYAQAEQDIGDWGLTMIGLPEAMYHVQDKMGSEFFALMSVEHRDLLHEMIAQAARRIERYLSRVLEAGITGLFGYVGPELCIPPLMSPRDFDDFVTRYDAPLVEMIHEAGGLVWVHCHGDMDPVLERFADEQHLDCLNPLEPPPLGIPLAEAKRRVGDRMALEGNIESSWFELLTPDEMRRCTLQALEEGMPGGGFILCPTSDHSHWPVFSDRVRENYRVFVETAAEHWWY